MNEFIAKYKNEITGVLTGFDRLVFRGTLRSIAYAQGMDKCRTLNGILLKDFGHWAERCSDELEQVSLAEARRLGRPIEYLRSEPAQQRGAGAQDRRGNRDPRGAGMRSTLPGAVFQF
jgi:hypothetical protein